MKAFVLNIFTCLAFFAMAVLLAVLGSHTGSAPLSGMALFVLVCSVAVFTFEVSQNPGKLSKLIRGTEFGNVALGLLIAAAFGLVAYAIASLFNSAGILAAAAGATPFLGYAFAIFPIAGISGKTTGKDVRINATARQSWDWGTIDDIREEIGSRFFSVTFVKTDGKTIAARRLFSYGIGRSGTPTGAEIGSKGMANWDAREYMQTRAVEVSLFNAARRENLVPSGSWRSINFSGVSVRKGEVVRAGVGVVAMRFNGKRLIFARPDGMDPEVYRAAVAAS